MKTILNTEIDIKEKVPGNVLSHLLGNKSIQLPFTVIYDFETMIVETDDQSKPEELRKNKNKPSTIKTGEDKSIGFVLPIYHLEDIKSKMNIFFYIGKDCVDAFVENTNKIVYGFANFPRQKVIAMT